MDMNIEVDMKGAKDKPDADDEPFLIDPGSEDPGAGIDQDIPEPTPAADDPPPRR